MRKLVLLLVLFSPPWLKKPLLRWLCGAKIGRGVRIGWLAAVMARRIEIGDYCQIRSFTTVRCREVRLGDYSVIGSYVQIYGPASFSMGRHSQVDNYTLINVWEDVRMGDMAGVGARAMIVTHGVFLPYTEGYWAKFAGVTIGNRVWIAAGSFIHPGVRVGDDSFVNAMSVVRGDVPPGSVMEGVPARQVAEMSKMKRAMSPRRVDAAVETMLRHFAEVSLLRERGVAAATDVPGRLTFHYKGFPYFVASIPSEGPIPEPSDYAAAKRLILVVNRPGWQPPAEMGRPMAIDLTTLRTPHPRDKIHAALERFLRGYYGLKLEYW
ncbi:MAG: transferase [Planctomycetes bacterium]|nr:transferase [Planctomycetota bacterium]